MTKEEIEALKEHSIMLGQVGAYVEEFADNEESTVLDCVKNLLRRYYQLEAERYERKVEELEG